MSLIILMCEFVIQFLVWLLEQGVNELPEIVEIVVEVVKDVEE